MTSISEIGFSRRDRKRFVDVEFRLNRGDPLWVPPLRMDRMKYLDPERNPFFAHAEVAHFVATREGRDVGRIAAVRNRAHEEFHEESVGFFGFLEAEDDPEVFGLLFDAAADRLREQGLETLRGPASYDTNAVVGALVSPFDVSPRILMAYNREYVPRRIEEAGFTKSMDLLAYYLKSDGIPERIRRISDRLKKREGVGIRTFRKDRFDEEVALVKEIYNRAWERNWGFVPLTDEEFEYQQEDLRMLLDPDIFHFAEIQGRVVAFSMSLPDINPILRKLRSGRLLPTGIFRILLGRGKMRDVRLMVLGILPEYRNRGVDVLLYREAFDAALRNGYAGGECSWVLETNEPMLRGLEALGGELERRYRMYDRAL